MLQSFTIIPRDEILGINRRNLEYLFRVNEKDKYPLVDNKLLTKRLLVLNNIPVPKVHAVFNTHSEIKYLKEKTASLDCFVIKPSRGACGNGILILKKEKENLLYDQEGNHWDLIDISLHISSILSGIFSLTAQDDVAFIEEKVESSDVFCSISPNGLPDIRIIVYQGMPVMAMLRFPTSFSKGRANLHAGAMGVGIEMETGKTLSGVYRNRITDVHPDTGLSVTHINIPGWNEILRMAVNASNITGLGYVGVDVVLHKSRGPLIMELNARSGLSIQLVNSQGLIPRLKTIDRINKGNRCSFIPVPIKSDI